MVKDASANLKSVFHVGEVRVESIFFVPFKRITCQEPIQAKLLVNTNRGNIHKKKYTLIAGLGLH